MNYLEWHTAELAKLMSQREAMGHALLIHGPQGVGKLAFAMALAQSLLCEHSGRGGLACGACAACGWFNAGNHPDFRLVEPESVAEERRQAGGEDDDAEKGGGGQFITVNQVRALGALLEVSAHRGGAKVIVLHPAESLNIQAANALLKSLEEPPEGSHFVLVAHRPGCIPPTVLSRCRRVPLGKPGKAAAVAWLRAAGVDEPETALAHAGDAPLLARELADGEYWRQRGTLLASLSERDFDPLATAERIRDYGAAMVLACFQKWTFDLLLRRCAGGIRYNPDFAAPIQALAAIAETLPLLRYHGELVRLQRVAQHPLNARLLFEMLLTDYQRAVTPARAAARAA
jgi:DNA polymerase-3 subunit delta'